MKEISKSKYIYLNDNGTLLFYGNEKTRNLINLTLKSEKQASHLWN